MNKETLFDAGVTLARLFCEKNLVPMPTLYRLGRHERLYHLATCAFYRPTTINIMVEKCAHLGYGGRAWSWPAYVIDRTPYGVVQHELGHHIDHLRSGEPLEQKSDLFSYRVYEQSKEEPLTGYLGTDSETKTFYQEWFAENFRLYVTNPDLSLKLRPRFYAALIAERISPVSSESWETCLASFAAPERIVDQARKKIITVQGREVLV